MTERLIWVLAIGLVLTAAMAVVGVRLEQRRIVHEEAERRRFEQLARSLPIADPAILAAWVHVVAMVSDVATIDMLIEALADERSIGLDEFGIEICGDEVEVYSPVTETQRCSRAGLLAALRELSSRARGSKT